MMPDINKIPTETPENKLVLTNLKTLVSAANQKRRTFENSEEYTQSRLIQKYRQIDRNRQADGEYNNKRREEYAAEVETKNGLGHSVREYRHDPEEQAKNKHEQSLKRMKKHRAGLTEEQKAERRTKDAERKRMARAVKKAEADAQRDENRGIF